MKKKIIDSIFDISSSAEKLGIARLMAEDSKFDGRFITLGGKRMVNFGLCSYLGLELNEKVKKGAIDAVLNYGIAFPCSRSYVSSPLFKELEYLCSGIFECDVVLASNTTLAHQAAIPIVVEDNDVIIVDQMAHSSLQHIVSKMQVDGIPLHVVRHNDLTTLENKVVELANKYDRVWFVSDGIYSMYGDVAPLTEINKLLKKYKKMYYYVDDAHGMSWKGKYGRGFVLDKIGINEKMVVAVSFGKAFGTGGAALLFGDETLAEKVKRVGGPLIFSSPSPMPVLGAGIASARIHLSDEMVDLQERLKVNIDYCQRLLRNSKLPMVSDPSTPICFMALGLKEVGYKFIKKVMDDGFYLNLAIFPAVPLMCTGARFTLSVHHTKDDIRGLVESLKSNFLGSLKSEGRTFKDIQQGFRRIKKFGDFEEIEEVKESKLILKQFKSINELDTHLWNRLLSDRGMFDSKGLEMVERVYQGNSKKEENWEFYYFTVEDDKGEVLLATVFTKAFIKDDMLESDVISEKIEKERVKDPYYLCSETLMMGTQCTEGDHLFLDYKSPLWKEAMALLIERTLEIYNKGNLGSIYYRDFDEKNNELKEFMANMGFQRIPFINNAIIENSDWKDNNEYLSRLNVKQRQFFKYEIFPYEKYYEVKVNEKRNEADLLKFYNLYQNVRKDKFQVNIFEYPLDLFRRMIHNGRFDVIELYLNDKACNIKENLVSVIFCYKSAANKYFVFLMGLDYQYVVSHGAYKQTLYQSIKLGNKRGAKEIFLGGTTETIKKKFGAKITEQVAYGCIHENINYEIIQAMSGMKKVKAVKSKK